MRIYIFTFFYLEIISVLILASNMFIQICFYVEKLLSKVDIYRFGFISEFLNSCQFRIVCFYLRFSDYFRGSISLNIRNEVQSLKTKTFIIINANYVESSCVHYTFSIRLTWLFEVIPCSVEPIFFYSFSQFESVDLLSRNFFQLTKYRYLIDIFRHNYTLFILHVLTYYDFLRILLFLGIWIEIKEVDICNILFF